MIQFWVWQIRSSYRHQADVLYSSSPFLLDDLSGIRSLQLEAWVFAHRKTRGCQAGEVELPFVQMRVGHSGSDGTICICKNEFGRVPLAIEPGPRDQPRT